HTLAWSLLAHGSVQLPEFNAFPPGLAVRRHLPRAALITEAGCPAEAVYVIRTGQVRVFLLHECGRETTTAVLGPDQIVGISPLLGRPLYHAFAEAITPVEVLALPVSRLKEQLPRNTALLYFILTALGRRLALTEGLVRNVTLLPVAERLPDVLCRLQEFLGGEPAQLTHEQLGGLVGARRETVSRAVATVQAQQWSYLQEAAHLPIDGQQVADASAVLSLVSHYARRKPATTDPSFNPDAESLPAAS
ncbi:MAG TPA: Crp/Fnr family transcriptional regulator, partial [Chloroflexota bacterium]|nr:Crp/Fnr family transcriptional regulator [Chloroflexota bacterium]